MPAETKKLSFGQKVVASAFAIGVSAQIAMADTTTLTAPTFAMEPVYKIGTAILGALAIIWAVRKAISLVSRG